LGAAIGRDLTALSRRTFNAKAAVSDAFAKRTDLTMCAAHPGADILDTNALVTEVAIATVDSVADILFTAAIKAEITLGAGDHRAAGHAEAIAAELFSTTVARETGIRDALIATDLTLRAADEGTVILHTFAQEAGPVRGTVHPLTGIVATPITTHHPPTTEHITAGINTPTILTGPPKLTDLVVAGVDADARDTLLMLLTVWVLIDLPITVIVLAVTAIQRQGFAGTTGVPYPLVDDTITVIIMTVAEFWAGLLTRHTDNITGSTLSQAIGAEAELSSVTLFASAWSVVDDAIAVVIYTIADVDDAVGVRDADDQAINALGVARPTSPLIRLTDSRQIWNIFIYRAITVIIRPIADLRVPTTQAVVTEVTRTVVVHIALLSVGDLWAVVTGVAYTISILIHLLRINMGGTEVTAINPAITIAVRIAKVGQVRALITGITTAVMVSIKLGRVGDIGAVIAGVCPTIAISI